MAASCHKDDCYHLLPSGLLRVTSSKEALPEDRHESSDSHPRPGCVFLSGTRHRLTASYVFACVSLCSLSSRAVLSNIVATSHTWPVKSK